MTSLEQKSTKTQQMAKEMFDHTKSGEDKNYKFKMPFFPRVLENVG